MTTTLALVRPTKEIQTSSLSLDKHTPATLCNPEATRQRDELLMETSNIERVAGQKSLELATQALQKVKGMLNNAEKSRKSAKEPFFHVGKQIDAIASDFVAKLLTEEARLKSEISKYQTEVIRKEQEERRKAEAEARRIEAEQRRIQDEADRQKREAEAEAKRKFDEAASEANEQRRMKLEEEAQDALQVANSAQQTADLQNQMLAVEAANNLPVEVAKPTGLSANLVRKFKVIDAPGALQALYAARPDLVDLVPRTADINRAIRAKENGAYVVESIPGLELVEETDVRIRA